MKVFAVLLVSGLAMAHAGGDEWKMYKTYTDMKAMESCYGEENMKKYTVEVKKAVAKCHQVDAPELSLPPFKSTYRFINTLMSGASEMEQEQMQLTMKVMNMMGEKKHYYDNYHHNSYGQYSNDRHQQNSWLENMIFKIMKNKYDGMNSGNREVDFNRNKYRGDMFDFSSKYDSNDFAEMVRDQMFEKDMMEKMMSYKAQRESYDEPTSYSKYNPFANKNSYRERMTALLRRNKRDSGENVAVTLPESLDIGDRLAEKLQHQKTQMESKIGNMTCVLREIGVLNLKNELDFNVQKRHVESYNMPNTWLKNRILNDMETCIDVAKSQPAEYNAHLNVDNVNVAQIKSYMRCTKYAKMRSCMFNDVKTKLETNFGPLEDILEQTQLTEEQLFPLVIQLLHGEEMEYF